MPMVPKAMLTMGRPNRILKEVNIFYLNNISRELDPMENASASLRYLVSSAFHSRQMTMPAANGRARAMSVVGTSTCSSQTKGCARVR